MRTIITFPQLELWQKEPFDTIKDSKNSGKTFVVKSVRQCGKSVLSELLLIYYALSYPNTTNIIIEPTNGLNRKIFKDITKMLDGSGAISSANASVLEIEFSNGSSIICKSAEQRDALRGFTASGILIYDECTSIQDEIFDITLPFRNAHKAPVLLVSTPKFKRGRFYEYYMDKDSIIFDWATYDTSKYLDKETLERYRRTISNTIFMQDYQGLFTDMQGSVFGDFGVCIGKDIDDSPIEVMSIDWGSGSGGDNTAIVLLNKSRQMAYLEYFNDKDATETIDRIYEIYKKYNPKTIVVEGNSIGSVYKDLLKNKINKPIKVFTTTNESKNRIINQLQVAIQNKDIQLIDDNELLVELSAYEQQLTKTGKPTFNAQLGTHDDIIMSLAIGLDSLTKTKIMVI